MDNLKQNFNNLTGSAKEQIDKFSQKPNETPNNALNKGKDQMYSAADNARSTLDKALGKGDNNNA
ncbi:hypothetical protein BDV29DRAFT_160895 [Aspergillus leporis]|uniref:Uncharacterized protein n=1 Tax=Aspergillus leporis TaxID=41062 RepID=A0A5N5WS99_9EURO|nr:hypothetical protein BDV29DRAFT_160895 [Aspergillus leporis]